MPTIIYLINYKEIKTVFIIVCRIAHGKTHIKLINIQNFYSLINNKKFKKKTNNVLITCDLS